MTSQTVAAAIALSKRGNVADAVAKLDQAGDAGDVDALMQLAVWYLAGKLVDRDLDRARRYMRQAVAIGHVDGALMEAALTANGNGNATAPDWHSAWQLLTSAAVHDPVAAHQVALINAMRLTHDGAPQPPPVAEHLRDDPRVTLFPAFLSPAECQHVATVGNGLLEPAQVIDPKSGRTVAHPIRTSDNGAIGPAREDMVIRAINLRIAAATDTAVTQGEPLTVLRYRPGQQYRPHLDTIKGASNQRIKTVLLYLNGGFAGGQTTFPHLSLTVTPSGGDALLFDTVLPDGRPDRRAQHAGEPVRAGAKWVATRWIRASAIDPWTVALA